MSNEEIVLNIKNAIDGNLGATFNLILQYENLIDEECVIGGKFSQECKDYVVDHLLKRIKNFKKFNIIWKIFIKVWQIFSLL